MTRLTDDIEKIASINADEIREYLIANGPSTAQEIEKGVGWIRYMILSALTIARKQGKISIVNGKYEASSYKQNVFRVKDRLVNTKNATKSWVKRSNLAPIMHEILYESPGNFYYTITTITETQTQTRWMSDIETINWLLENEYDLPDRLIEQAKTFGIPTTIDD